MVDDSSQNQAFRLKGTMPALTLLYLQTTDLSAIESQLKTHLSQMPQFFLNAPLVIDLEALTDDAIDIAALGTLLRRYQLVPVAIRNPTESYRAEAVAAGWGVLQRNLAATRPGAASSPPPQRAPEPPPEPPARHRSAPQRPRGDSQYPQVPGLTMHTPVRAGQVVHAVGGDLVVLAPVNSGAELIADGNIHVYAPLRGRAAAGARDNPDASIYCLSLEAEFVSIAGRYLMAEDISKEQRGRPARVHLVDDELIVSPL
jgi:septum site-determining protein MinC